MEEEDQKFGKLNTGAGKKLTKFYRLGGSLQIDKEPGRFQEGVRKISEFKTVISNSVHHNPTNGWLI